MTWLQLENKKKLFALMYAYMCCLGVKAHADILRMVATLLVLQLMRLEKLEEGKLLRTLFCLEDSSQPRSVQKNIKILY